MAPGLLFDIQEAAEERQAASHRQDASMGHDAWQGHGEMGARAGTSGQQACYNRNLHSEEEEGASCVRAVGVSSAVANVM